MIEYAAYAFLVIVVPIFIPLWTMWLVFRTAKRRFQWIGVPVLAAVVTLPIALYVIGGLGYVGAMFLGCALHDRNSDCEYIAWDTVVGGPHAIDPFN